MEKLGFLTLYGMIGKVKKDEGVVKCIPVFRSDVKKKCYTVARNEENEEEYTQIDVGCYGTPLFVPSSRKKIDDGKEYFFIFQKRSKQVFHTIFADASLQVGIYDNAEFCVLRSRRELTEEEMTIAYLNIPEGSLFK